MNRQQEIIKTSVVGIFTNIILAGFKVVVGLLSRSIAIVMDAVNNLSDALSSVITIIGTKLASKPADKEHPYGYGRIEYMSAFVISVIVLYAGITSLVESVKKIIEPETPNYSTVTLIVVVVGVVIKIVLGKYFEKNGEKLNSDSLVNSGKEALMDAIISTGTLIAALIYIFSKVTLEAYLAAIISLFIIKSGVDMLKESISRILGERIDSNLSKEIKKTICTVDGAIGAYDLRLHSYGPDELTGSVHVEVDGDLDAVELDTMSRNIQEIVYKTHGVILDTVGFYGLNEKSENYQTIKNDIRERISKYAHIKGTHGYYVDPETKKINFDVVIDFDDKDPNGTYQNIVEEMKNTYPEYTVVIGLDRDTSD